MTTFNRSTRRRLQKLRQVPSVWEGDRRSLAADLVSSTESSDEPRGECILWVDGTEAVVRAMDVVPADAGPEALVRTLIRAMEFPHSAAPPARPQKIVVRNREAQFFLRGVLQELDIHVDYAQDLPLIDEIFRGLYEAAGSRPPQLPEAHADALLGVAHEIWNDAPWQYLDEEKIIAIKLNHGDIDTLYISLLGMLGVEYGILMYRSLDSLKKFRQAVLDADESTEHLEEAFLEQDCFFLTFERGGDRESFEEHDDQEMPDIQPAFGNLHPLEGMRPVLHEEEAIAVLVALQALHRFFNQHFNRLNDDFPEITSRYRIPNPNDQKKKISVKVSTLPELAEELFEMSTEASLSDLDNAAAASLPVLRHDLVPHNSFFSLGALPWDVLEVLRHVAKFHQPAEADFPSKSDGFPIILIQTSRPKALGLIEAIQSAGGLQAICFNPGEDPFAQQRYDLGILQTHNGDLHLFGEFIEDDPIHVRARKKWDQRCKKTNGHCGLVIARGLKGASRGNPKLNDMMAVFEVRSLSASDLGLGPLELIPHVEMPQF
ncbi:MAG: DUF6930 domain-containing protein [Elainellaceae cyanobacterium]